MRDRWVDHRKLPGADKSDITVKLVALACVIFVILAIILMYRSPATDYEMSIYASTPFMVWFLLFLSLVGGIGIVVHQLATGRYQENRTCLVGFAVIMLTAVAFLCLPFVRNYFTWRGDQMGHIGFVTDIATKNHIPGFNPYPVSHTMLYEISAITDTPVSLVVNLNTAIIFVVYVLTAYLLGLAVMTNRLQQMIVPLIVAGAVAGLSRFNLVPNTWSILLLPLLFYCYFKRDAPPFRFLLILLLLAYPFIHPLSALMIVASLAMLELGKPIYTRVLRRRKIEPPVWISSGPVLWPLALELVVFLPWLFTREAFRSNLDAMWWQLQNFSGSKTGAQTTAGLDKLNMTVADIIVIFFKMYGEIVFLGVFALLGIVLVYKALRRISRKSEEAGADEYGRAGDPAGAIEYRRAGDPAGAAGYDDAADDAGDAGPADQPGGPDGPRNRRFRLLYVGLLFVVAAVAYVLFFAGAPGAESISAPRLLVYVEVASIPLVAYTLWHFITRARRRRLAWGLLAGVIIMAAILNVAAHHAAPYQERPGEHITHADMQAMEWYLEEKDPTTAAWWVMSQPDRFSQAILGSTVTFSRPDVKYVESYQFQDHFNYSDSIEERKAEEDAAKTGVPAKESPNCNTIGEMFETDIYINICRFDKVAYQTIWKELDRFNNEDYAKLEQDPTVNRIYSDGTDDCLFVTGHKVETG